MDISKDKAFYLTESDKPGYYRVNFFRFIKSADHTMLVMKYIFINEFRKRTVAKYHMIEERDGGDYIWRLDGRSVRYMNRVKIIENLG